MARKLKCPVCNSCMSFLYIGEPMQRYIYCGFCKVYRQGSNDNLQIVESPYSNNTPSNVIEDPVEEE